MDSETSDWTTHALTKNGSTIASSHATPKEEENETLTFFDVKVDFYCSMAFTICALVVIWYLLVTLSIFSWKKEYFKCLTDITPSNARACRDGAIMASLLMVTLMTLLVYMAIEVPLFLGVEEPFCTYYHGTKILCTAIGLFNVYFALWYRVFTVFYRNPLLRQSASRTARNVNVLSIFLLILMTTVNAAVFLTSPLYVTTDVGCIKVQSKDGAVLKWSLLVSTTVTFQAVLVFSFIYPLYLHRKKLLGRGLEGKSIIPPIRRAAFTAGICILSDTLNALFALTNKQTIVYTRHIVYGTNMMINFFALLFSFADWRQKIFPCTAKRTLSPLSARPTREITVIANGASVNTSGI